jgi:hypothetical protein
MRRSFLPTVLATLLVGAGWPGYAENVLRGVQLSKPSTAFVGTWRSGGFAYTFSGDGKYVYVGAMGGTLIQAQTSEEGTYAISGEQLTITRRRGVITTSQNYRQDLGPETRVYHWRLGNTEGRSALQLIFPNGQAEVFYKQ